VVLLVPDTKKTMKRKSSIRKGKRDRVDCRALEPKGKGEKKKRSLDGKRDATRKYVGGCT
jgi:hypothetical protein